MHTNIHTTHARTPPPPPPTPHTHTKTTDASVPQTARSQTTETPHPFYNHILHNTIIVLWGAVNTNLAHNDHPKAGQSGPQRPAPGQSGPQRPAPGQSGPQRPAPRQSGPQRPAPGRSVRSTTTGPRSVRSTTTGPRSVSQSGPIIQPLTVTLPQLNNYRRQAESGTVQANTSKLFQQSRRHHYKALRNAVNSTPLICNSAPARR